MSAPPLVARRNRPELAWKDALCRRLTAVLFAMIATTIMGILITVALSAGFTGGRDILVASAAGFILSFPASWLVARSITRVRAR
jgi:biotin transporter BioY